MKHFSIITWALLVCVSCSQINKDSQVHYSTQKKMRHGIVPIELKVDKNYFATKPNRDSILRGEKIYKSACVGCHGVNGDGFGSAKRGKFEPKPANLVRLARSVPIFKFYMYVSQDLGKMPGWKRSFSDNELGDLENYIRDLSERYYQKD